MTDAIKPNYRVFAIDESENWAPEILAITGKIAGVYVVNFNEVTHLCSLEGSYWAQSVCNITENYVREPDGYNGGVPIWPDDLGDCEGVERGKALAEIWRKSGESFYGLAYVGAEDCYLSGRIKPVKTSPIELDSDEWGADLSTMTESDAEEYRRQRDKAAMEAVSEYMANGEDWADLAPWAAENV
jgi:hypothetical protein